MEHEFTHFVHANHLPIFSEVAQLYNCHILVRKTGIDSIYWIGRNGYTGKRGDMKAKTAKKNVDDYQLAGLVCSPEIHPGAYKQEGFEKIRQAWLACAALVTVPPKGTAIQDWDLVECGTPYILQNNPRHKHYGCVAWVEGGLVTPRYVHGDYDLYAIVPAGKPFDTGAAAAGARRRDLGSLGLPKAMGLQDRLTRVIPGDKPSPGLLVSGPENQRFLVDDHVGPLSFRIATAVNSRIAEQIGSYTNALMVNHGEQVNIGHVTHEAVLAFFARRRGKAYAKVLTGADEHRRFFAEA